MVKKQTEEKSRKFGEQTQKKHSGYGVVSYIISLSAIALVFLCEWMRLVDLDWLKLVLGLRFYAGS
jgi:hypothetical protein